MHLPTRFLSEVISSRNTRAHLLSYMSFNKWKPSTTWTYITIPLMTHAQRLISLCSMKERLHRLKSRLRRTFVPNHYDKLSQTIRRCTDLGSRCPTTAMRTGSTTCRYTEWRQDSLAKNQTVKFL